MKLRKHIPYTKLSFKKSSFTAIVKDMKRTDVFLKTEPPRDDDRQQHVYEQPWPWLLISLAINATFLLLFIYFFHEQKPFFDSSITINDKAYEIISMQSIPQKPVSQQQQQQIIPTPTPTTPQVAPTLKQPITPVVQPLQQPMPLQEQLPQAPQQMPDEMSGYKIKRINTPLGNSLDEKDIAQEPLDFTKEKALTPQTNFIDEQIRQSAEKQSQAQQPSYNQKEDNQHQAAAAEPKKRQLTADDIFDAADNENEAYQEEPQTPSWKANRTQAFFGDYSTQHSSAPRQQRNKNNASQKSALKNIAQGFLSYQQQTQEYQHETQTKRYGTANGSINGDIADMKYATYFKLVRKHMKSCLAACTYNLPASTIKELRQEKFDPTVFIIEWNKKGILIKQKIVSFSNNETHNHIAKKIIQSFNPLPEIPPSLGLNAIAIRYSLYLSSTDKYFSDETPDFL
jgi:hypothetical protein